MKQALPRRKLDELHIRHLMAVLRRRWKIVAMALMIGIAFATAFELYFPAKYESSAQLLVMRKDPRLAARGMESTGDTEVRVTEELLATHMQMIQSRSIVEGAKA